MRTSNSYVPAKQLLVILDRYEIPSADTGDVFTVNSYDADRFKKNIPTIGKSNTRASDTLDFRPRVGNYTQGNVFNHTGTPAASAYSITPLSFDSGILDIYII